MEINLKSLLKKDFDPSPIVQFEHWYKQAHEMQEDQPSAMCLATVSHDFDVNARMVLLKAFDKTGFVFFTNYNSPKSQEINETAKGALVFWWHKAQRQIRIQGTITRLEKGSDEYFATRARESQIAAIISKQSQVIRDRDVLLDAFSQYEKQHADEPVLKRPADWGGFKLKPHTIEFWQGAPHRLHDRFQYRWVDNKWVIEQLSP